MNDHLAAWQNAELILGCLDEGELKAVYGHFDECVDCVEWRRALFGPRLTSESQERGLGSAGT